MKTPYHYFFRLIPLLLLSTGAPLAAQTPDTPWSADAKSIFNQLYNLSDTLPALTVTTDMYKLINQKYKEEYQPAAVSFADESGTSVTLDFRLRARGNRRKEVCFYPPIRFKFTKSYLVRGGWLPFNDLKIVNQCKNNAVCREYLLKEYIAYRLYNLLTPYSFRVRLVTIKYYDSKRDKADAEMLALVLEPAEELIVRLNAVEVEQQSTRVVHLEREVYDQLCLFQYMIGNTDWNVTNRHNLITIKAKEYPRLIPIPYDFDYSGLVNTDYAIPHPDLPIETVTEPYHMGAPLAPENLERFTAKFRELEPAFRQTCRDIAPLDERAAQETEDFIQSFFELLKNKERMQEIFIEQKQ